MNRNSSLFELSEEWYTLSNADEQRAIRMDGGKNMKKYECTACGHIYDPELGDPENGIKPGTAFEDLPEDWVCPVCGVGKDEFEPVE